MPALSPHRLRTSQEENHLAGYSTYLRDGDTRLMLNRIKELRDERGMSLARLEEITGISAQQINRLEKGTRRLNEDNVAKLAAALGCRAQDIFGDLPAAGIPVVGFVGAGAEIYAIDDHEHGAGLDEVDAPPGAAGRDIVAVRIRGDSMFPVFQDGWTVYYGERITMVHSPAEGQLQNAADPLSDYFSKPCAVRLVDGRTMLKTLKRGTVPGRYNLVSYDGRDIEDVELDWAARILFIKTL
jgi:transcriptional regulator with XRE-family HTH domain